LEGDNRFFILDGYNYLSSQGINSLYALTMNAPEGDGKDVFMWLDIVGNNNLIN
jgi:hypothetical protein